MSESDEGVSLSVTRQNAGTDVNAAAAAPVPFGGVNAPAATVAADMTEPFDSVTPLIEAHAIGAAPATRGVIATTTTINAAILMWAPVPSRARESSELYVSAPRAAAHCGAAHVQPPQTGKIAEIFS